MQTVVIDYIKILNYLANNQEIPYYDPKAAGLTSEERDRFLKVKEKGVAAVAEIKKIAARCKELYGLDKCLQIAWLDGSNTKTSKYLCAQMKYKDYATNPISISLFVEKNDDVTRYRVSLEIKNDGIDKKMMATFHSHLDIPKAEEMVYVSGSNEWGNPIVISDDAANIKKKIASGEMRKVQPSIYINPAPEKTNEQYDTEIMSAVKRIIPYYEHVIGKTSLASDNGRAWLITWNSNNWNWDEYKSLCVDTKLGKKHTEPWTCANKQPLVGDEIFLIKIGSKPRGILAHGHVARESYEAEHYDLEKAAQGKKASHIDAEFDWIQDYDKEPILLQDDLKKKFPNQQWSPMGSGIAIKTEVLPELRKLWAELVGKNEAEFWPSIEDYPIHLTKDDWKRFIEEVEYPYHKGCMRVLKIFLVIGGTASCKELANRYGNHPTTYISSIVNTCRRAIKYFCLPPFQDGTKQRYFPVGFQGKGDEESGNYVYRMRDTLFEALSEIDLTEIDISKGGDVKMREEFDKNLILYGPPGTGKTYSTAIYAVAICDGKSIDELTDYEEVIERYNELKKEKRIIFTTFHQSYGYEEFIEGIKPQVDEEEAELGYTIEPGVFKRLCEFARTPADMEVDPNTQIWFVRLDTDKAHSNKEQCFLKDEIRFNANEERETDNDLWFQDRFVDAMQIGDYVLSYADKSVNIDGIGVVTGEPVYDSNRENYRWMRKVTWLHKGSKINVKEINDNRYLPNFEFARMNHMKVSDLLTLIPTVHSKEKKPYVFVIDEINRGNISKIFGELITLIEDTKREGMEEAASAILPYSGESFSVPSNVYIIGTMNTADRSIALMDTALRRRFQFVEMMPDSNVLRNIGAGMVEDLDVALMLDKINERITFLYDREHTIGHAFFTKLAKTPNVDTLKSIFEKSVLPLLQEYFYEDYHKIQLILGDNGKTDPSIKFILDEDVNVSNIFKGKADDVEDLPDKKYTINADAFDNLESYKQII